MYKNDNEASSFKMPDYSEKITLAALFLTNNENISDQRREQLWNFIHSSQHEIASLVKYNYITEVEGQIKLTSLGVSIASKLYKVGVNFDKSAQEGRIGNAMAMLSGAIKAIKDKVSSDDVTIYKGKPLYVLIERTIADCKEILKRAVISDRDSVKEEKEFQTLVDKLPETIANN